MKISRIKLFLIKVIVMIAVLAMFPISAIAGEDADITQLLKEFQVEDNPLDSSIINSNIKIVSDGMDTFDNSIITIFMEPAVSDNYDKICPFFEKSNFSGIQMFVDGKFVEFVKYDNVRPDMLNGRVFVPIRAIVENLGAKVEWIAKGNLTRITLNNKVVEIAVDSNNALLNGKKVTLDVPVKSINGRTIVPARFIAESFEKTVEWHPYNDTLAVVAIY